MGNNLLDSVGLRVAIVIVTLAAGVYLVRGISDILSLLFDLLLIIFLAWILSAAVHRLALWVQVYVPRPPWAAVPIAYLLVLLPFVALIALLVPITIAQTASLSEELPDLAARLSGLVSAVNEFFASLRAAGGAVEETAATDPLLALSSSASSWVQENALGIVGSTTNILIQTVFCLSLSFYMTIERDQLRGLFYRLLPVEYHERASVVMAHLDNSFFSYLKGISIVVGDVFSGHLAHHAGGRAALRAAHWHHGRTGAAGADHR